MLYLVSFNEKQYTRRMESFVQYIVEFDASITGAGVLWYTRQVDDTEVALGGRCS